jgi:hypothetical protein
MGIFIFFYQKTSDFLIGKDRIFGSFRMDRSLPILAEPVSIRNTSLLHFCFRKCSDEICVYYALNVQ